MILSLRAIRGVLCSIALLLTAVTASAQETVSARTTERRSVPATRLASDERIALDGQLTESFWPRVVAASDFIQIDPDNGTPATERTEVRIAFDAEALYLGVTCYDTEPDRWIAYQRRRDEFLGSMTSSAGRSTPSSTPAAATSSR